MIEQIETKILPKKKGIGTIATLAFSPTGFKKFIEQKNIEFSVDEIEAPRNVDFGTTLDIAKYAVYLGTAGTIAYNYLFKQ